MPNYPRKAKPQRIMAIADPELGLPKLTPKQEAFVQALLDGKGPADAYRLAYDTKTMRPLTVSTEACKLRANPKIANSLRYFQRNSLQTKINSEMHLAELARLRELAIDERQISAGVQAEHYRGKVAGLYEDRLKLAVGPSDEAILSQLAGLLGPELASAVARGLGHESQPLPLLEAHSIDDNE